MAGAPPPITGVQLWITEGGFQISAAAVRAFDWTLEVGENEEVPVAAGDAACTVATHEITPVLFQYCTTRPAMRLDEVDFRFHTSSGSRRGGYRMSDVLVSSFRVHDAGGIVGLETGLTTLTFDWRSVEVSTDFVSHTYTKKS